MTEGQYSTLTEWLRSVALGRAKHTAIVEGDTALSYEELEMRVGRIAGSLYQAGIGIGDVVALVLPNGADFVAAFRAVISCGAVAVPLNPRYRPNELTTLLETAGASLALVCLETKLQVQQALEKLRHPLPLLLCHEAACAAPVDLEAVRIDPDTPAFYLFTSGTTGAAKPGGRTHRRVVRQMRGMLPLLQLGEGDRFLGAAPFSHATGLMFSVLFSQAAGACLYPAARFERRAIADLIQREKLSVFVTVPSMFTTLAEASFREVPDLGSLRWAMTSGAPMPPRLNRLFQHRFGPFVRQLYGTTETGTISMNLEPDIEATLESQGRPLPWVEVKVTDRAGRVVAPGEIGEICVRSETLFDGYVERDAPARQTFRNGYYPTGDLGRQDDRGLLYLAGRVHEQINKAGFKIDPAEVEEVLAGHPMVAEAAVVGEPTPYGDNRVKAVIVPLGPVTVDEIMAHCRSRLADYKVPSIIEFRAELPRSPSGKVRRGQLRGP